MYTRGKQNNDCQADRKRIFSFVMQYNNNNIYKCKFIANETVSVRKYGTMQNLHLNVI